MSHSAFIQTAGTKHILSVIRGIWPEYRWLHVMNFFVPFMRASSHG